VIPETASSLRPSPPMPPEPDPDPEFVELDPTGRYGRVMPSSPLIPTFLSLFLDSFVP
jgi:hypothetical protein